MDQMKHIAEQSSEGHTAAPDSQTDIMLTQFSGQWADPSGGGFHFVFGQHEKSPPRIHPSDVLSYAEDFYPHDKGFVQAMQRARRIRVCVNACAGVPSSVLEAAEFGAPNVAEWFRDWSALPAEAHELGVKEWSESLLSHLSLLRGALEACMAYIPGSEVRSWPPGHALRKAAIEKANEALRSTEVKP